MRFFEQILLVGIYPESTMQPLSEYVIDLGHWAKVILICTDDLLSIKFVENLSQNVSILKYGFSSSRFTKQKCILWKTRIIIKEAQWLWKFCWCWSWLIYKNFKIFDRRFLILTWTQKYGIDISRTYQMISVVTCLDILILVKFHTDKCFTVTGSAIKVTELFCQHYWAIFQTAESLQTIRTSAQQWGGQHARGLEIIFPC